MEKKKLKSSYLLIFFKILFDPFLFQKMEESTDLIIKHIKAQNKIFVFGDYDADGVTSSALMFEVLTLLKARVEIYIPHRVLEGYGMNAKAIDYLAEQKAKLIITVDNGIRNKNEVEKALKSGIDVVFNRSSYSA